MKNKEKIFFSLRKKIEEEIATLAVAAEATKNAATHEESRAEDQHDTRSTEASYLAAGQFQRVQDLRNVLHTLELFGLKEFQKNEPIQIGAFIELELNDTKHYYLLSPVAGGYKINVDNATVNVITSLSAMGEMLLDKSIGDAFFLRTAKNREYSVTGII